ncbi:hypothetical protein HW555_011148 [Spodoptera exigua]|uniref:C2H2-type domain-containing protein n=1 Tax=Spodoptera exigua TaxID=7107 RepID=A0A835G9W7_SPOEX|nr:hypothetical protein HW555_011148 [Spodoptera exigua]
MPRAPKEGYPPERTPLRNPLCDFMPSPPAVQGPVWPADGGENVLPYRMIHVSAQIGAPYRAMLFRCRRTVLGSRGGWRCRDPWKNTASVLCSATVSPRRETLLPPLNHPPKPSCSQLFHQKDSAVPQSIGNYECDICKIRTESLDKLVSHLKCHTNRYKCRECGLVRACRTTILDHFSAYHSEGVFHMCPYCSKTFKRQACLRKHVSGHRSRARVHCVHCQRSYKDADGLRAHMLLKHAKEISAREVSKKYVCQECGTAFKTPSHLKTHGLKHTDSRNYYCVECDKSFKSAATLKTHLQTTAKHTKYIELP